MSSQSLIIANRFVVANTQESLLGRGGMSVVYQGLDMKDDRVVAVKQLHADLVDTDPNSVARFTREGEALRQLNHPHIVQVYDMVQEHDQYYIIMEYLPGGSLKQFIQKEGRLSIQQVLQIGLELADALARAHHLNIIHRDIKPGNILLTEALSPRLTDFGVAHMGDDTRMTAVGAVIGTYAYLCPEAWSGEPAQQTNDIWALGVVLYEMLTGELPFAARKPAAMIMSILRDPVPDLRRVRPEVPPTLAQLVQRMLAKDPENRISSARQVATALEAILQGKEPALLSDSYTTSSGTLLAAVGLPTLATNHLPTLATPFVGRGPEVAEIKQLILNPDCRLLTLLGPGGMGKTRLSLQVANVILEDEASKATFSHGMHFVSLAPLGSADLILAAVADTLEFKFFGDDPPQEQLLNYLAQKEALLIMDNFEHILDGADLVADIIYHAPGVKVLATSRESLNLEEEWLFQVGGMRYPENGHIDDLQKYSAVRLFVDRAQRVKRHFDWQKEQTQIIRICRLVEGMPLGIELAASWLKRLSPQQIGDQIEKDFDFLTTKSRNVTARHRSIRAVFDYSWDLLSNEERQAFSRLSVFKGDFSHTAAQEITNADLMTLMDLVDKSLLRQQDGRYDMHELLRQYAGEKLALDPAQEREIKQHHARYYVNFLGEREADLKGEKQPQVLDEITQAIGNIYSAWVWAIQQKHLALIKQAMHPLYLFFLMRNRYGEGIDAMQHAIVVLDTPDCQRDPVCQHIYYYAQLLLITVNRYLGSQTEAIPTLRQCLTFFRETEAQHEVAHTLYILGTILWQPGSPGEEQALLAESVEIFDELGDKWYQAYALMNLAGSYWGSEQAQTLQKEALAIFRELKNPQGIAQALTLMTVVMPDVLSTKPLLRESLEIYQQIGNRTGVANVLGRLAWIDAIEGKYEKAIAKSQESLKISQEVGVKVGIQSRYRLLTQVARLKEDYTAALAYAEKYLAVALDIQNVGGVVGGRTFVAQVALDGGNTAVARHQYEECLSLLSTIDQPKMRAEALDAIGNLAMALGEYETAEKCFCENQPLFVSIGDDVGVGWSLRNLGTLARHQGDYETSRANYEEVLHTFQQYDHPWRIAAVLVSLGKLAWLQNDKNEAKEQFARAWALASQVPDGSRIPWLLTVFLAATPLLADLVGSEQGLIWLSGVDHYLRTALFQENQFNLKQVRQLQQEVAENLLPQQIASSMEAGKDFPSIEEFFAGVEKL